MANYIGYNNLVSTLNTLCGYYVNAKYADKARSLGSNPNNPNGSSSSTTYPGYIDEDEDYLIDYSALNNSDINFSDGSCWLASRKCNGMNLYGRTLMNEKVSSYVLCSVDDLPIIVESYVPGVRACIKLKTDVEVNISDTTKDGSTQANAWVLK